MLKSNLNLVRKFLVLTALLGGLAFAGMHENQPVKAQQCCTTCEILDESCQAFCENFPNHPHCRVCAQQVVACAANCDPGC